MSQFLKAYFFCTFFGYNLYFFSRFFVLFLGDEPVATLVLKRSIFMGVPQKERVLTPRSPPPLDLPLGVWSVRNVSGFTRSLKNLEDENGHGIVMKHEKLAKSHGIL